MPGWAAGRPGRRSPWASPCPSQSLSSPTLHTAPRGWMARRGAHLPGPTPHPHSPAIDLGDHIAPGTTRPATAQLRWSRLPRRALACRRPAGRQSRRPGGQDQGSSACGVQGAGPGSVCSCDGPEPSPFGPRRHAASSCSTRQGLDCTYVGGDRGRALRSPSRGWSLHLRRKACCSPTSGAEPGGRPLPRKSWADGRPFLPQRIQETTAKIRSPPPHDG